MLPRFYVPDLAPDTGSARLGPDESHHLSRVLRLARGDLVAVFDGRGVEWHARVESASRDSARLSLLEPISSRLPNVTIVLAQAVLKHDAMDDAIRDCTMVGVAVIQPLVTSRATVKTSAFKLAPERWRRVALSSAKQCGTARLPEIAAVMRLDEWLQPPLPEHTYLLIEPGAAVEAMTLRQLARISPPARASLLVGPEGGWTTDELASAIAAGATPLSLGPLTLRAATVGMAASAALLGIWSE